MDFQELADERRRVQELCRKHIISVTKFKPLTGPSFALFWDDVAKWRSSDEVRHLTTTATCIESLRDCTPVFRSASSLKQVGRAIGAPEEAPDDEVLARLRHSFCVGAVRREDWVSEDSAPIYCATRALPLLLDGTATLTGKHESLLRTIFEQLHEPGRFAIGEKAQRPRPGQSPWYPENAYHTYWALEVLRVLSTKGVDVAKVTGLSNVKSARDGMLLWARARLGQEVGLHWAQSAALDSDQLTWALAIFIRHTGDLSSNLGGQDLVRKAFAALGSTQEPVGTWRHYRPLFVYSNVGNAYCYVYESFAYLLRAVLEELAQQEYLEDVLRSFLPHLTRLRSYAEITQVQHGDNDGAVGWCSGHRPADCATESWATASVFSFFQAYRRILGILVRTDALHALPKANVPADDKPEDTIAKRGGTWVAAGQHSNVAEDLVTLFVNPVRAGGSRDWSEPDAQPIAESQARSAILFGPPGSSKTALARAVAQALRWSYVELHASHFVSEGIEAVQRTADRLFKYLMQLDHAVVLFDEPDELVREREDAPDAFGRFLTTSMLPKLAELWSQQRVIYFVATNHIRYFDAAITRARRFDVSIFVAQPSFERKCRQLEILLAEHGSHVDLHLTQADVDEVLRGLRQRPWWRRRQKEADLPMGAQLAKLVLLRWDQLDELALLLMKNASSPGQSLDIGAAQIGEALRLVADQRLQKLRTYLDYLCDVEYGRRDFQRKAVYALTGAASTAIPESDDTPRTNQGRWLRCSAQEFMRRHPEFRLVHTSNPGELEVTRCN